jgi:hypothetical protein
LLGKYSDLDENYTSWSLVAWISLGIVLAFLGACLIGGEIVSETIGRTHIARVLQESLVIGGWVAMWRPLEILLYDWWPILAGAGFMTN